MAYKGSFYYDEFDYGNYPETLDYDTFDEHLPSFGDVFNCGVSVSRQIAVQLLCLLSVNFVYRAIRHASELADGGSIICALHNQKIFQIFPTSRNICLLLCSATSQPSSSSPPATFSFACSYSRPTPS